MAHVPRINSDRNRFVVGCVSGVAVFVFTFAILWSSSSPIESFARSGRNSSSDQSIARLVTLEKVLDSPGASLDDIGGAVSHLSDEELQLALRQIFAPEWKDKIHNERL